MDIGTNLETKVEDSMTMKDSDRNYEAASTNDGDNISGHVMALVDAASTNGLPTGSNNKNSESMNNSSSEFVATYQPIATETIAATTTTSNNSTDNTKDIGQIAVSQQQQQEVYSILAMLHSGRTSSADVLTTNIDKNQKQQQQQEIETPAGNGYVGEFVSLDEEGRVTRPVDDVGNDDGCADDDNDVEFSGGLNSGEASVGGSNLDSQPNPMTYTRLHSGISSSTTGGVGGVTSSKSSGSRQYYFGKPKLVQSIGKFPELGSILGPFFCLGQLGKGTFSSIHKCINMKYFFLDHQLQQQQQSQAICDKKNGAESDSKLPSTGSSNELTSSRRLAAAKVELVSFQKSGVLESEATILDFLHTSLPSGTVPVYMGHFKSEQFAAIFMEYLPGQDMHQLREYVMARTNDEYTSNLEGGGKSNVSPPTRRINVKDAVYLTADVMLSLLQRMHNVGVVHRDVKPSNCVRAYASGPNSKQFCMVDFGLSKSIIVPEDSVMADKQHFWDDANPWLKPYVYQNVTENPPRGCYLAERKKADFRGTSMYASLRVHQCRDYCPRDDVWSLLYVFCDLVSGGLPWMQHAANRDRDACQRYKERIHGESLDENSKGATDIPELLKGDIYHKAVYQREKSLEAGVPEDRLPPLPTPLAMHEEPTKVQCLAKAFQHLAQLEFWEKPDYKLIYDCIHGFLRGSNSKDPIIRPLDWDAASTWNKSSSSCSKITPIWGFVDDHDVLDDLEYSVFEEAEDALETKRNPDDFLNRIPLQMRFRLAQMDYNVAVKKSLKNGNKKSDTVPIHRALNDWLIVTLDILYKEWNSKRYEPGGHRTGTDGFKRECYLQLLEKCRSYARVFQDFASREIMYVPTALGTSKTSSKSDHSNSITMNGLQDKVVDEICGEQIRPDWKRRRILFDNESSEFSLNSSSDLILVSKCILGLDAAIRAEQIKKPAPPVRISFG